jgi:hypothetical protein
LDTESPLFARKFVEKSWLVLLWLSDYKSDIASFWPVFVNLSFDWQEIRIVWTKEFTLKTFFLLFLWLWFEVVDWNYFVEPQTPEQIKKVLDICKRELDDSQKSEKEDTKKKEDAEKKIYYQDEWLEKAKQVIAWSLEKVNSLLVDKWAFVSAKDLRTIKEKVDELKKLRMWTNYEKIRDMLQELFSIVDRIEEEYFISLEDSSQGLFEWTCVTKVDLERQVSILEKVQQQQMFGWNVSIKRKDYVALWDVLIYLMFLKKDFLQLFRNLLFYVYRIFDFLQIWIILILVFLWISIVYFTLISSTDWLISIYYSFFSLWFLWVLAFLSSYIKSKNPLIVWILLISIMIIYFVSIPILKNTFALS